MTKPYDLIVLGGGSGGLATAFRVAKHGARVAVLDPREIGGTCVHRGCVPKKAMWLAAQLAQAQQLAVEFGFDSRPGSLDWTHFVTLRQRYIDGIGQRYAQHLQEAGIEVVRERGRLVAADTVALPDSRQLKAPHVLIAAGARPRRLSIPGFELGMVSDDMFSLRALPKRVAVVGGGYVAMEFAGLLHGLGANVQLLTPDRILHPFDVEIVHALTERMQDRGIDILRQCHIRAAHQTPDGITLDDSHVRSHGPYDTVLWAVGRVPNSELLGLDAIGVDLNEDAHVRIDKWSNTTVPGVYAVGDITTQKALTPVAVMAGRRLADRLFGGEPDAHLDETNIPSVTFAEPPLGMVGLTETQAREQHGDAVTVHHRRFTPMQSALVGRHEQTVMKLVCVGVEETVAGIHMMGHGVDEMLQGYAVALKLGMRKRDLDTTVAIHPTSAEELLMMS